MADMELYQGEVSPLILISPPNDGVTTTLDAAWACKLGIYNDQDVEKLSRTITLKQVSDVGQPEREYFSTFFTEIETAALAVGEYTIAVLLYETSTSNPPKYCKEVHKTLTISKGLVPAP
jgi:hypothetical protein